MKSDRPLFFFVAIGLIICGSIAEVAPRTRAASELFQDWQRYTVDREEFSVMLPALPAMRTRKIYSRQTRKTRTERELAAYANGIVYTILAVEKSETIEEFILTKSKPGTSSIDVSLNGFKGKQFQADNRGLVAISQFFMTKNHLYRFTATGAAADDPRVKQFFDSITLGGKRQGTEVKDGIGARSAAADAEGAVQNALPSKEVDRRAVVVSKPEPSYTESARQGRIVGTVILKGVFGATGEVTDIRVVSGLPYGLTEQAILSAKQIRFVPAMKNGQFVSTWMQLEYNFNLY